MLCVSWSPQIGDPTVTGWFTVFAYFSSAYLCLRAFMAQKAGPPRPYLPSIFALLRVIRKHFPTVPAPAERAAFWLVMSAVMAALGLNKQLDLQSLLTEIGRSLARSQGWYQMRNQVQYAFILAIVLGALAVMLALLLLLRRRLSEYRIALLGLAFLLAFIVIRAASFHHVDRLIKLEFGPLRANFLLEFPGILIVGLSARRAMKTSSSSQRSGK